MCLTQGDMATQRRSCGLNLGLPMARWLTDLCRAECNFLAPSLFLSISLSAPASHCHGNQLHAAIARQNLTSSVFLIFCFLLWASLPTARNPSTVWTPTHTWKIQELTFSGKTLDSTGSKAGGLILPIPSSCDLGGNIWGVFYVVPQRGPG